MQSRLILKEIQRTLEAAGIVVAAAGLAMADAPVEQYHVLPNSIADRVRIDAVGVLTINSGQPDVPLQLYKRSGDSFLPDAVEGAAVVTVKSAVTPVSNFGYPHCLTIDYPLADTALDGAVGILRDRVATSEHSAELNLGYMSRAQRDALGAERYAALFREARQLTRYVENYRVPITAATGVYLQIVLDPVADTRAWVSPDDLVTYANTEILWFDSLARHDVTVDCASFSPSGKVELYTAPHADSLKSGAGVPPALEVIAADGGYLKVAKLVLDPATGDFTPKPVGWVRVRDDAGRFLIWPVMVDRY